MNEKIEMNIFDEVEYHFDCAVQVLRNSLTGEVSLSWTPMDSEIAEQWMAESEE